MAFTYDLTTNIGKVRFLIGDTDSGKHIMEDADITYALTQKSNNIFAAAAFCCDSLAARFAPDPILRTATYNQDRTLAFEHYRTLATDLRKKAASNKLGFIWRPLTQADKDIIRLDSSIIQPTISRNMHQNRGVDTDPDPDLFE